MPEGINRRRLISSSMDAEGVEHLSLNFRRWTGVLGFIGAVLATSATIAALTLSMLHPVVDRWINEATRPSQLEMSAAIVGLREDLVQMKRETATRVEIDTRMARMEDRLDDIYQLIAAGKR